MSTADVPLPELVVSARRAWAAVERGAVIRHDLALAGCRVRLEIGGASLAAVVLPALEVHPAAAWDDADVDVVVRAYDSHATGAPLPAMGERGYRQLHDAPGRSPVRALWQPDHGYALLADPGGVGHLAAVADAAHLPWWEAGAPLRQLLAWALRDRGRHFLHAAGVGDDGGVLLLAGAGGAGKSTTAVACLLDGLGYLGDDYCVLTSDPDGPVAHALYGTTKLLPEELDRLADGTGLLDHVLRPGDAAEPKATLVASRWGPARMLRSAPVRAVVVPARDGPPGIAAVSAATALRHLAPTSLFQLAGHGADDLRALGDLVRRVPCLRIRLDPDRRANPARLRELLDSLASRPR